MTEKYVGISNEFEKECKMAETLLAAIYEGPYGTLINFGTIPTEVLTLLFSQVKTEIDWRNMPNSEKGGH